MTPLAIEGGAIAVPAANEDGIRAFKGIPYAAPPMGLLRWRPPQPVQPWTGIRPTDTPGPNAPQRLLFPDIDAVSGGQSEDCLFLNVWSPHAPGSSARSPVVFYIHGGGFAVGFGAEKRYDGARLAKRGVVVVTMNYRLNALGLLAHPALTAETGSSGNYAMLDLVAALHWVKRNIAAFGGDPDQVTIMGESAGSMFVSLLMVSPLARGLFHRAIGESGAAFPSPERPTRSLHEAEEQGLKFAAKLKAATADQLRAVPVEAILNANPGLGFWPIVDGHAVTEVPAVTFGRGGQADVPLLAGWNRDEGMNFNMLKWPMPAKSYLARLKMLFGAQADTVLQHYPGGRHMQHSARALGADLVINHGTWAWLEAHRQTAKSDVFRYRFDHAPVTTWFADEPLQGAFHSCEIPYVMDNVEAMGWTVTEADHHLATVSADYFMNFVKTGNPNGAGLAQWPSYRNDDRPLLLIDKTLSVAHDLERARYDMLLKVVA
jgi:para-nitrobenzyl esterase